MNEQRYFDAPFQNALMFDCVPTLQPLKQKSINTTTLIEMKFEML
jgi:hypothetical protein